MEVIKRYISLARLETVDQPLHLIGSVSARSSHWPSMCLVLSLWFEGNVLGLLMDPFSSLINFPRLAGGDTHHSGHTSCCLHGALAPWSSRCSPNTLLSSSAEPRRREGVTSHKLFYLHTHTRPCVLSNIHRHTQTHTGLEWHFVVHNLHPCCSRRLLRPSRL